MYSQHNQLIRQPLFALPVRWDFPCWTNSDYVEELSFQSGSQYLDLTDHSFKIEIKSAVSGTLLKSLSTVGNTVSEGIFRADPIHGMLQVRVSHETLTTLFTTVYPNIMDGDEVSLPYDMLVTLPNTDQEAWLHGFFNLNRGITHG